MTTTTTTTGPSKAELIGILQTICQLEEDAARHRGLATTAEHHVLRTYHAAMACGIGMTLLRLKDAVRVLSELTVAAIEGEARS